MASRCFICSPPSDLAALRWEGFLWLGLLAGHRHTGRPGRSLAGRLCRRASCGWPPSRSRPSSIARAASGSERTSRCSRGQHHHPLIVAFVISWAPSCSRTGSRCSLELGLAEGAVGSASAAAGLLAGRRHPIIAILFLTVTAGIGAILGAQSMLATLAMFVTGSLLLCHDTDLVMPGGIHACPGPRRDLAIATAWPRQRRRSIRVWPKRSLRPVLIASASARDTSRPTPRFNPQDLGRRGSIGSTAGRGSSSPCACGSSTSRCSRPSHIIAGRSPSRPSPAPRARCRPPPGDPRPVIAPIDRLLPKKFSLISLVRQEGHPAHRQHHRGDGLPVH